MSRGRNLGRYVRTVRHMRARQIFSRIRLRSIRSALKIRPDIFERRWTLDSTSAAPGWPAVFAPLDRGRFDSSERADDLEDTTFLLLNERVRLGRDWQQMDQPQLWRFHLHYWDWCWHLVNHRTGDDLTTAIEALHREWRASTTYGKLDAWSPYVVSLRLWTWCGVVGHLPGGSEMHATLVTEIRRHAGFLRANLETDVGGNHLMKNLKALLGAAAFLGDRALLRDGLDRLTTQLRIQVLADGGHYELSQSYHAQVLGDLLDIQLLLHVAEEPSSSLLDDSIAQMQQWLSVFVGPDGEVPVFNDAFAVDPEELARLRVPAPAGDRLVALDASGYIVVRPRPDIQVVIDVGHPCPAELPAHAHADCLSFELVVGNDRVIVDAGTSEYGSTAQRQYERSTAAHNTIEVDGVDQTEVWGAFRAGRRAIPRVNEASEIGGEIIVDAQHNGYRHLTGSPVHRRKFLISRVGMIIQDIVDGDEVHRLVSRLRFPGNVVALENGGIRHRNPATDIELIAHSDTAIHLDTHHFHARNFGVNQPATVASTTASGSLPIELQWTLTWS